MTDTLTQQLAQFTGTENYYQHPIQLGPRCNYTDGVKYFAEQAQAYWFLDIVFTELNQLQRDHEFLAVTLQVTDNQAVINATNGNDLDDDLSAPNHPSETLGPRTALD